jgi:hypothetical protein
MLDKHKARTPLSTGSKKACLQQCTSSPIRQNRTSSRIVPEQTVELWSQYLVTDCRLMFSVQKEIKNLVCNQTIFFRKPEPCNSSINGYATTVCHHGMPSQYATTVYHHIIPQKYATTVCHHGMPPRYVTTVCYHSVPPQYTTTVCHKNMLPQYATSTRQIKNDFT